MYFVYVREAHPVRKPSEGKARKTADGPAYKRISQAQSLDDRAGAATECIKDMKLSIPFLIDSMDSVVQKAYQGHPAGTVVIDKKGKIAFYSRGPRGTKPKEAEAVIKKLLGDS